MVFWKTNRFSEKNGLRTIAHIFRNTKNMSICMLIKEYLFLYSLFDMHNNLEKLSY